VSDDGALQPGDAVRLKSGSPAMTVASIGNNAAITCVWRAPDGTERRCVYPAFALERVPHSEPANEPSKR
jgi:uncharacterized protein YodC (DUF2158 family)